MFVRQAVSRLAQGSSFNAIRPTASSVGALLRAAKFSSSGSTHVPEASIVQDSTQSSSSSKLKPSPLKTPTRVRRKSLIITAAGPEQSGIVNHLLSALPEGSNVEESRMTVLGDDFALILLVTVPENLQAEELKNDLLEVFPGFMVGVRDTENPESILHSPFRVLRLTLEGPDQPGVLKALSDVLAEHSITIRELQTETTTAPFAGYKIFSVSGLLGYTADNTSDWVDKVYALEEKLGVNIRLDDPTSPEQPDQTKDAQDASEVELPASSEGGDEALRGQLPDLKDVEMNEDLFKNLSGELEKLTKSLGNINGDKRKPKRSSQDSVAEEDEDLPKARPRPYAVPPHVRR